MDEQYELGYQHGQMDAEATLTPTLFEEAKVSVGISRDYNKGAVACINMEVPLGSDLHVFFESIASKKSQKSQNSPDVPPNAIKITTGQASILISKNGGKPIVASNGQNLMTVGTQTYYWGKKKDTL